MPPLDQATARTISKPTEVWRDAGAYLARALHGDAHARDALVRAVAPIIQVRVYKALSVRRRSGRDVRQEVEDLTQDILVSLFAEDARVLRAWDPARGLSFANYVGLVAEREVGHRLRSRRRSPWSLEPTEDGELAEAAGTTDGPELHVGSRQKLTRIWARLKEQVTPRGLELFQRLFIEGESVDRVCEDFGMQPASVYAWRSRFLKRAREVQEEIEPASDPRGSAPSSSAEGAS